MLVEVPSKDTATVVAALSRHVCQLLETLRRSLTWDRGLEMAQHQSFTVATNVKVYFLIPRVLGSAARTKTQMGSCASTCRRRPTCPATAKRTWTKLRCD